MCLCSRVLLYGNPFSMTHTLSLLVTVTQLLCFSSTQKALMREHEARGVARHALLSHSHSRFHVRAKIPAKKCAKKVCMSLR